MDESLYPKSFPTYKGPERRRHRRLNKQFMAGLKLRDDSANSSSWDMVTLNNIGAGGVYFSYDKNVDADSFLDLRINLPASPAPIGCTGKVVRIEKQHYSPLLRVAAVFIKIGERDRGVINRTVEEFYTRGLFRMPTA